MNMEYITLHFTLFCALALTVRHLTFKETIICHVSIMVVIVSTKIIIGIIT